MSEEEINNRSAFYIGGLDVHNVAHTLEVRGGYWSSLQIVKEMFNIQAEYHPAFFIGEKGPIQKAVEPFLRLKMQETGVTINLELRPAIKDKVTRAYPIKGRVDEGMVTLPKRGPDQPAWLGPFRYNLRRFPKGKDKDEPDAFAWFGQALEEMFTGKWANAAQ